MISYRNRLVSYGLAVIGILCLNSHAAAVPRFPIGMNVGGLNYYTEVLIFNDVMTTASEWITYDDGDSWNTRKRDKLQVDDNGYPLEIPQTIDGKETRVRFMLNNNYKGTFRFTYDGEGEFLWKVPHKEENGHDYITLDGKGGHKYIQITSSTRGNHIRNISILPESLADTYDPANPDHLFNRQFVKGLRPWHAIRFMNWTHTNGSELVSWDDRPTPTSYSQGTKKGVCLEYAIMLCNFLKKDGWFCLPHAADDNFIREHARLVRDNLHSGLTAYVEHSNEMWNWGFDQAQWACRNGRWEGSVVESSDELRDALRQVGETYCDNASDECSCHPEKDAYLMARTFGIWKDEFEKESQADRLVRVAAIQVGWCANSSRILKCLDDHGGADALSPTMYFNFTEEDHDRWNAMDPSSVTPEMILDAVSKRMDDPEYFSCVQTTAEQAKEYGLDIVVYEAGQHMQPWKQGGYDYNQAVWDAQIHPGMYDLYVKYWGKCDSIYQQAGGIKLNCAFSYVGERESRWGSWGHLESLEQLDSLERITEIAPKWAALLAMNSGMDPVALQHDPRTIRNGNTPPSPLSSFKLVQKCGRYSIQCRHAGPAVIRIHDSAGRMVDVRVIAPQGVSVVSLPTAVRSGIFFLSADMRGRSVVRKFAVP